MKKRELLPALNKAIMALTAMSADAAKLEVSDNDQASRRLKKAVTDFRNGELRNFQECIFNVRMEFIKNKTERKKKSSPVA